MMINVQATLPPDANTEDITVTSSRGDADGSGTQLRTVPRPQFSTADNMKHTVSIDVLASDEDDSCL